MLIDTHVHPYAEPVAAFGRAVTTIEGIVDTMDRLGIDGTILVSAWGAYADDPSYIVEGYRRHPDRFRLVAPFDVRVQDLDEKLDRWRHTAGAAGLRLLGIGGHDISATRPGVVRVARAAEHLGHPLCVLSPGSPAIVEQILGSFPSTRIVVDHLGLGLGLDPDGDADPLADLAAVVRLARYDNAVVKIANVGRLSRSGPPFEDMWSPVARLIDAFGVERCMWGSDWTVSQGVAPIDDLVGAFLDDWPLTARERARLMGGTAAEVFRWR